MELTKENLKNLVNMLRSPDKDNAVVAVEAFKQLDLYKHRAELILLYKFGEPNFDFWKEYYAEAWELLIELFNNLPIATHSYCLNKMYKCNASNKSIEIFVEFLAEVWLGYLDDMDFPTNKLEVSIKLRE
jgi:hypothetical protein